MDYRDAPGFQPRTEAFLEVDVLTRADGNVNGLAEADKLVGVLPRNQVFDPGQVIFLQPFAQANAIFQGNVAEMVSRERYLIADHRTHFGHIFFEQVDTFFGQVDPGQGMGHVVDIVAAVTRVAFIQVFNRPLPAVPALCFHLFHQTEWVAESVWLSGDQTDPDVHFQESEAAFHACLEGFTHFDPIRLAAYIRVTVNADFISEFAT